MMIEHIELLAPGGSYDAVKAAYVAGADAVYTGGRLFGARAYADNLTDEQLIELIDYAHINHKKLYLTVNTLLKNVELEQQLYEYLEPFYLHGLDAVIVQDFGVMTYIHEKFPELDIHASTQMIISSEYGAEVLKECGVTRLVTPRELSLEETARIHQNTGLEIESFVHGALCYCYSGQCLMSSLLGGRSGNRGRCAQPCRLPYSLTDEAGEKVNRESDAYFISMKDLCTIETLPKLLQAGITSFKIEGRMKRAEYTAGVVSVYRRYLDKAVRLLSESRPISQYRVESKDMELLAMMFSRNGFTEGYYEQHNGKDMIMLTERRGLEEKVSVMEDIHRRFLQPDKEQKLPIGVSFTLHLGQPACLCLYTDETSVTCYSEELAQLAAKQPLTESGVKEKLLRFGSTPFTVEGEQLFIQVEDGVFFSVRSINELRQRASKKLMEELLKPYRREQKKQYPAEKQYEAERQCPEPECDAGNVVLTESAPSRTDNRTLTMIQLQTAEQLKAVVPERREEWTEETALCISDELADSLGWETLKKELTAWRTGGRQVYWELPYIFRDRAARIYDRMWNRLLELKPDGFLVHSIDGLMYMKRRLGEEFANYKWIGDSSCYALNDRAEKWLRSQGMTRMIYPYELNRQELSHMGYEGLVVVYGRIPMMISAQCPRNTFGRCSKNIKNGKGAYDLVDRRREKMPLACNCKYCYTTIYNSKVLYLLDRLPEVRQFGSGMILRFTDENYDETCAVLHTVLSEDSHAVPKDFTRGHYKRGVE